MKKILNVNATKDRIINITKNDACKAVLRDHHNCVIAKAIKRQTGAEWVDVGATTVLVKRKERARPYRYLLDSVAREQVRFFDTKGKFAPCKIILSAPPVKHGSSRGSSGPSGKSNRRTLATR